MSNLNNSRNGNAATSSSSSSHSAQPIIPMTRVKTIMKSSPEISTINQDTLYLVCKATEQFINYFSNETYKHASKEKNLDYKHFSNLVASDEKFQFLAEIIPPKVKAREALAQIKEAQLNQ